jgi:hypothetical protein
MKILTCMMMSALGLPLAAQGITGAWQSSEAGTETVMIVAEGHFSAATYKNGGKTFVGTRGGKWKAENRSHVFTDEFNTIEPAKHGVPQTCTITIKKNELLLKEATGKTTRYTRIDDGRPGALAGAWLITGRQTDTGMQTITPGDRKTMKILSGTRFQWIAYNSKTNEFFGTGGGTYTTQDGRYTENIGFFSRDSTRVGMQLNFDFSLPDGAWRHQGKSSKGDPIDELWTRRERLGI